MVTSSSTKTDGIPVGEVADAGRCPLGGGKRLDLVDVEYADGYSPIDDREGVITEPGKRVAQRVRDQGVRVERRSRHGHHSPQPEAFERRLQRDGALLRLPRKDQEEADQAEPEEPWRSGEDAKHSKPHHAEAKTAPHPSRPCRRPLEVTRSLPEDAAQHAAAIQRERGQHVEDEDRRVDQGLIGEQGGHGIRRRRRQGQRWPARRRMRSRP